VDDAIDSIEQLLNDGLAAAVIELSESALHSLVGAMDNIDDSDGHMSALRDRLENIHHRACVEARPDPIGLAKRLFQWEINSEIDAFYDAAARYAEILGPQGLKAYSKLAESEWENVPVRTAGDQSSTWGGDFRITHIMECLARLSGDPEQLINVISRDLSNAYSYLRIAELCREAGQPKKALLWAEKGLKAFPEHTDIRLREFAAAEYHRLGRHNDAMKLMWAEFSERPWLLTYRKLEEHAKESDVWPKWRDRAPSGDTQNRPCVDT
jgi:tetratricopeptide (TPR) repeat protein